MTKIHDLVVTLTTQPTPVLCLDTCDLLDSVRGIRLRNLSSLRSLIRLRDKPALSADCCQVVVTYLVKHEWDQNLPTVRTDATADLRNQQSIDDARSLFGSAPLPFGNVEQAALIDGFVAVVQQIIDRAVILERDAGCIDRALERVMGRKRPSHKNEIKDSIHLGHYLELARRLRSAAFAEPCLFVSGNKADFWAKSGRPRSHPELDSDLKAAGLTFFARLEDAVRHLGI